MGKRNRPIFLVAVVLILGVCLCICCSTGAYASTTTVGNGVDPADVLLAPGGSTTDIDAFTLKTSDGSDTVTGVGLWLLPSVTGVGQVLITSDDGSVIYGSVTNPVSTGFIITLDTNIPVTTTETHYKVRVAPRNHSEMPSPAAGANYEIYAKVVYFDSLNSNTREYNDTTSATVTIDNESPDTPVWGTITPMPDQAKTLLTWANPSDTDFSEVVILRRIFNSVGCTSPVEGVIYNVGNTIGACDVVYAGNGTEFTDSGVFGYSYDYGIFAADIHGNYSVAGNYVTSPVSYSEIFDFQEVPTAETICSGTSTVNVTSDAGMSANGALVISNSFDASNDPYHFNWTNSATGPATNLSHDMFTPEFSGTTYVRSFLLRLYGNSGGSDIYAKLYDFDGSTCWSTLIGQTSLAQLHNNCGAACMVEMGLDISPYQVGPGHRIRMELWVQKNGSGVQLVYGQTHLGFIELTGVTTQTTTVGPGTVSSDSLLGPGGPSADLDAFTLQTSGGTDSIDNVMVWLSPSDAYNSIGSISITNDTGTFTYGSVSDPSSYQAWVPLTTFLIATTTPVEYKVRITPKTHSAMSAPPGGTYSIQGTVTALSSMNTKIYNDTTATTVTIDNQSPENPVWGAVTSGDTQLAINWSNPADADFSEVIVLRSTEAVVDSPVEGSNYAPGDIIGSSTVRYAGSLQSFMDVDLTNNTNYYYRIFSKDTNGNYSTGAAAGPYMPLVPLIVGNGANPSDLTVAPGGAAAMIDAFTLQTTASTATVTGMTVTLAIDSFAALGLVEVTSDNGGTVYGSVANPLSDTVSVTLATNITATTSLTQYKVRVTPKSHANLPSPPGSIYPITGTVTAVTTVEALNRTYSDYSSATVAVDNFSPGDPSWGDSTAGDTEITLNWTNPADADFAQVIVLRNTSAVADAPVEGTTYAQDNAIGSSTVRYVGSLQSFTDTGLSNNSDYFYKIFAKDTHGNYSVGQGAGPHTPAGTITIDDGTNPDSVVIGPGGPATMIDSFTLQASTSAVTVTGITVSFAAGTSSVIDVIEITDDAGTAVYGSVSNPSSDTVSIALLTPVSATTSSVQYKVRVTPRSHLNMPPLPNQEYVITGMVTAIATSQTADKTYGDVSSAIITVDNLMPGNPVWGSASPFDGQLALNWTNPSDADFSQVVVLRNNSVITDVPAEGTTYAGGNTVGLSTVGYSGSLQNFVDTGLSNGTGYFYRIFSVDSHGNYSSGVAAGPYSPQPNDMTMIEDATAVAAGISRISIVMPYTDDANSNNTYTVDYRLTSGGTWMNWTTGAIHVSSPFIAEISGLQRTSYDVRMTYNDVDGVFGTNPQTIMGIDLTATETAAGTATAGASGTSEIVISMPYVNDSNSNNTYTVEYKLSSSQIWTNWAVAEPHSLSPYSNTITGLTPDIYDVRMTYNDPDGCTGTNPQTVPGVDLAYNMTSAGTVTAVPALNSIKVYTPFDKDANTDNLCTIEYSISGGAWIYWTQQSCHAAETVISNLNPNVYDIRVTYEDPDGIIGTAVQKISSVYPHQANLVHNSVTVNSSYWAPMGWGVAGGMYGEFTCSTCHARESANRNQALIRDVITLNGEPRMVSFQSRSGPESFGDDSMPRFMPPISRICEVCHTQTSGLQNTPMDDPQLFGPIHRYEQPEPANHFNANGTSNCTRCCHTHETGFARPQYISPNCSE